MTDNTNGAALTRSSLASGAYQGNDKLLLGIVLAVVTFWLFAQTTLNIAPIYGEGFFVGRTDNIQVRYAAAIALLFNVFMVIVAMIAILKTVPPGRKTGT